MYCLGLMWLSVMLRALLGGALMTNFCQLAILASGPPQLLSPHAGGHVSNDNSTLYLQIPCILARFL